ncbi:MAG: tetratricopeptide repeat protein [Candidatus Omnitrophica bacterium]|nr:tetratricopeptide repeat protein [Candidatus Omnitrophota bacterium]
MKKKLFNPITVFLLISWISVAFFACLYVATRIQNLKLKNSLAAVEEKAKILSEENKRYEDFKREEIKFQDNALSYMEWQFVLKEQVSRAAKLLQEKINQVKDVKKDKELLNLLYYNLGLNNTLAVNFDAAIKAFEQAVDLEPKDADSYYNLGLLYSTYQQNPRKAVKYYGDYLKLVPKGAKSDEVKERIGILNGRSK